MTCRRWWLAAGWLAAVGWTLGLGAAETPVARGVAYLEAVQDAGGLWSPGTVRQELDTAAVIEVLTPRAPAAAAKATAALEAATAALPATTVREALLLRVAAVPDATALLALQNADGGWGLAKGKQSDPLHTVLASAALQARGLAPAGGWDAVVTCLVGLQGPDGYWMLAVDGGPGQLELTARVCRQLLSLEDQATATVPALQAAAANAVAYLRAARRADGRFSLDPDLGQPVSAVSTAEVYRTLVQVDAPGLYADTLALLAGLQAGDGSWSEAGRPAQTVYTTAVVLQALGAATGPEPPAWADLAVYESGITFTPVAPEVGVDVTVRALLINRGAAAASGVAVGFYLGDPRLGGTPLGPVQAMGALGPGASVVAAASLATAGMTTSPRVFVSVDPANAVAESDEANNVASRVLAVDGLPPATLLPGIDLYTTAVWLTCNGDLADPVYLVGSPTVRVGLTVANVGDTDAGAFAIAVSDDGEPIGAVTVPGLAAQAATTVTLPWLPASRLHQLAATVDAADVLAEAHEDNNTASRAVTVIGGAATIVVKKWTGSAEIDPPFAAYDVGRLTVATIHPDAEVAIAIANAATGAPAPLAALPLATPGKYHWSVVNTPAGNYVATATFRDAAGTVLGSATDTFVVEPTVGLREVAVSLSRDRVEGGDIAPVTVTATLASAANVDSDWSLSWQVLDPEGMTVLSSTAPEVTPLPGTQVTKTVTLAEPVTGTLTRSGHYTLRVVARHEALQLAGETGFEVLPILRLNVHHEVVPAAASPLGRLRARTVTRLQVSGGEGGPTEPAWVGGVTVAPDPLADVVGARAAIAATGIVNLLGETVPDGTLLAVYVPYGTLTGGLEPPLRPGEAEPNPQIRLYATRGGAITVGYEPGGGTLGAGEGSLVVVEFHVYRTGETLWYGSTIGVAAVFLKGGE